MTHPEKRMDYGRMLTGLSSGISAIHKHDHALLALRSKLLSIVEEIDSLRASKPAQMAIDWYEAMSKEHDAEIKADYDQRHDAAPNKGEC